MSTPALRRSAEARGTPASRADVLGERGAALRIERPPPDFGTDAARGKAVVGGRAALSGVAQAGRSGAPDIERSADQVFDAIARNYLLKVRLHEPQP